MEQIEQVLGGRAALGELASYCRDPKVKAVLSLCKPSREGTKSLAELCEEVGITPAYFVGQVMATMWKLNLDLSKLVVKSQTMPQIIAKTAERALEPDGHTDRKTFLKHMAAPNAFALMLTQEALKRTGAPSTTKMRAPDPGFPRTRRDAYSQVP